VFRIVCRILSVFKASHARKQSSSKSLRWEHQISLKCELAWKHLLYEWWLACVCSVLCSAHFVMWRSNLSTAMNRSKVKILKNYCTVIKMFPEHCAVTVVTSYGLFFCFQLLSVVCYIALTVAFWYNTTQRYQLCCCAVYCCSVLVYDSTRVHQYTTTVHSTPGQEYNSRSVQQYNSTRVHQYNTTAVQGSENTTVHQYNITTVHQYNSTPVQEYISTTV
jgi:hypothetical protein